MISLVSLVFLSFQGYAATETSALPLSSAASSAGSSTASQPAAAVVAVEKAPVAAAAPSSAKAETKMNFEEILVQGKFQFKDEAVTTVEEDKVLNGLIGMRKDFKDRIRKTAGRR